MSYYGADENRQIPPQPPYNATNFTPANAVIYNTMVNNAKTQPNYPLNSGSDSDQINRQRQNVSYFTSMQQQTQNGTKPFPAFKLDQRRLMYIQGQYATASRNIITKENTSGPAGVPFYTPPSAPTLISAIQGFNGIVVTFTGPEFVFTSPNQACESQILSYQIRATNPINGDTQVVTNVFSSPYTITGISSATPYECTIAAVNAGGVGLSSNSLTAYVIPSPNEFQAIPTGASGTVTLYFNMDITAFNTGIYTIFQYEIIATRVSDQTVQFRYLYTPTDNTTTSYIYTATGLTNGVEYTFTIFAKMNPSNPQSSLPTYYNVPVTPFGPPLAPMILSIAPQSTGDRTLIITFQQPIDGTNAGNNEITVYNIEVATHNDSPLYSSTIAAISDSGSATITYSCSFSGVGSTPTPIRVGVSATNEVGTTPSLPMSTTVSIPAPLHAFMGGDTTTAPGNLTLSVQTDDNTIHLTFFQSSTGGLTNTYQYSKNGIYTNFTPSSTGCVTYYYKLTNIPGGTYTFAVKATNSKGYRVSNNVTVTVPFQDILLALQQQFQLFLRN
jgi:hypothetical protein